MWLIRVSNLDNCAICELELKQSFSHCRHVRPNVDCEHSSYQSLGSNGSRHAHCYPQFTHYGRKQWLRISDVKCVSNTRLITKTLFLLCNVNTIGIACDLKSWFLLSRNLLNLFMMKHVCNKCYFSALLKLILCYWILRAFFWQGANPSVAYT